MVNERLIEFAERHGRDEVPSEREESGDDSSLRNILERDEDGKPILNLTPLEETAVYTPTRDSYNQLIRVYECGRWWKWKRGEKLTEIDIWGAFRDDTCMGAGVDFRRGGIFNDGKFDFDSRHSYQDKGWDVISPEEFYERQDPPITPGMLNKINDWFENNGK